MKLNFRIILKCIGLLVILLIFLIPIRYVNQLAGYLGALFFILVIATSILCHFLAKRKIAMDTNIEDRRCVRGEKREASVAILNKSIFIIPRATAKIYVSDIFEESDSEEEVSFVLDAKNKTGFSFDSAMSHIGIFKVGIKDITLYDMFGLFKSKLKMSSENKLVVLPKLYDVDEFIEFTEAAAEENERGIAERFGMDYVGVREYERGDSMKEIHWKLSAKSREYLTKLKESNRNTSYRILLDFSAPKWEKEELMEINDCLIETALSVSVNIGNHDVPWSIVYFDRKGQMQRRTELPEDLSEIIADFKHIFTVEGNDKNDGASLIEAEGELAVRSSDIIIFTCNITASLIQNVINLRSQRRMPYLFVVIPERFNSREREKYLAPLMELEDRGITFKVLSTKEGTVNGYEGIS